MSATPPGRARRRRRPSRGRDRVRQMEDRRLPPSLQQATTRRVLPARGLKPPLAPLGPDSLRPGPPARPRAPTRDPDRRPRLVPHRVAMLAQPHPIRPCTTPRTTTPHHRDHPQLVGPRARPRRHPADGRRRCHPNGRPQAEREALDSQPSSATSSRRLTQDVFGDPARARRSRRRTIARGESGHALSAQLVAEVVRQRPRRGRLSATAGLPLGSPSGGNWQV